MLKVLFFIKKKIFIVLILQKYVGNLLLILFSLLNFDRSVNSNFILCLYLRAYNFLLFLFL